MGKLVTVHMADMSLGDDKRDEKKDQYTIPWRGVDSRSGLPRRLSYTAISMQYAAPHVKPAVGIIETRWLWSRLTVGC